MKRTKIVTFGEIMLRLSKPGYLRLTQGHCFEGHYGGSEANVAVSLAILGDDVEYVTRVPQNPIADAALMYLRQFGLGVNQIVRGGDRLGTYYFERGAAMRNSMVVYDRKGSSFYSLERGMIPWDNILQNAAYFHCSGITCSISRDAMDTTFDALRKAKELGVHITADINYRNNLWKFGLDPRDVLFRMLQYSELIFGDQNEWEVASGVQKIPFTAVDSNFKINREAYIEYFRKMHKLFPFCKKMVLALRNQLSSRHHILTGLLYDVMEDHLYTSRIYDIQPVVDPMGVGDAFVAAYIHAYADGLGDNQQNLDFALSASALKNTISGDQNLVSKEEIIDNMTNSGGRIQR